MQVVETIVELRHLLDEQRKEGRRIGFVPTMGALHEGHLSLLAQARRENDVVLLSIFVNPLQFGANEDLDRYPRPIEADQSAAMSAGVDLLFHPAAAEMYPDGPIDTRVQPGALAEQWEGERRPGHFAGMATVVAKLFQIAGPCHAYFGEKDWQQLAIVRQMVRDLSMPIEIHAGPTVREPDGLALSSRNVYLTGEQRAAAGALSAGLRSGVQCFLAGISDGAAVRAAVLVEIERQPLIQLDYVAVVDDQLREVEQVTSNSRILVAGTVGSTHLIDNAGFSQGELERLKAAKE